MSVYKKTCETGLVYYGSTKNELSVRENKGHYRCACKDFINPTMEVLEYIEDAELRYQRELYYIRNFPCVNISGKGYDKKTESKKYRDANPDKMKATAKRSEEKCEIWLKFNCPNCGRETNKKHLKRHQKSSYCISQGTTALKGPSPTVI